MNTPQDETTKGDTADVEGHGRMAGGRAVEDNEPEVEGHARRKGG
jgi:hypothetical protein